MSNASNLVWPEGGNTRIPYQIYSDPAIFELEMDRIFAVPAGRTSASRSRSRKPGDFKVTKIGNTSVVHHARRAR